MYQYFNHWAPSLNADDKEGNGRERQIAGMLVFMSLITRIQTMEGGSPPGPASLLGNSPS